MRLKVLLLVISAFFISSFVNSVFASACQNPYNGCGSSCYKCTASGCVTNGSCGGGNGGGGTVLPPQSGGTGTGPTGNSGSCTGCSCCNANGSACAACAGGGPGLELQILHVVYNYPNGASAIGPDSSCGNHVMDYSVSMRVNGGAPTKITGGCGTWAVYEGGLQGTPQTWSFTVTAPAGYKFGSTAGYTDNQNFGAQKEVASRTYTYTKGSDGHMTISLGLLDYICRDTKTHVSYAINLNKSPISANFSLINESGIAAKTTVINDDGSPVILQASVTDSSGNDINPSDDQNYINNNITYYRDDGVVMNGMSNVDDKTYYPFSYNFNNKRRYRAVFTRAHNSFPWCSSNSPWFYIQPQAAVSTTTSFFQTFGGDVVALGELNNKELPATKYLSDDLSGLTNANSAGILFGSPLDPLTAVAPNPAYYSKQTKGAVGSTVGWNINWSSAPSVPDLEKISYETMNSAALKYGGESDVASVCSGGVGSLVNAPNGKPVTYKCYNSSGNVSMSNSGIPAGNTLVLVPQKNDVYSLSSSPVAGSKVVLFVDGALNITSNITASSSNPNTQLIIVSNDDVNLTNPNNTSRVDGLIIADSISSPDTTNSTALLGTGMLYGRNDVNLDRTMNNSNPAEVFTFEPRYLNTVQTLLVPPKIKWQQLPGV